MRRFGYVLAFMLLLSIGAFGDGVGDYCIHISNGFPAFYDQALIGHTNTFEIWMANDAVLGGMSPAVEITFSIAYTWVRPYGTHPTGDEVIKEEGRAVAVWTLPDLQVMHDFDNGSLQHLMIGGAAMPGGGLPAGPSELCYTFQFNIPTGETPTSDAISIIPYVYPPAGTWTFNDVSGGYPPNFCGQTVSSEIDPQTSVIPVSFDCMVLPCLPPEWVDIPPSTVEQNHCLDYDFTFTADEGR